MNTLQFKLKNNSLTIEIESEDGAKKTTYRLVEMTVATRDKYMNTLAQRMRFDPVTGRPMGIKSFDGMFGELLSRCMTEEDTGRLVTKEEVNAWPTTVAQGIYQIAQKLNRIEDEKEEGGDEVKKE